jgi:hypothetical protein
MTKRGRAVNIDELPSVILANVMALSVDDFREASVLQRVCKRWRRPLQEALLSPTHVIHFSLLQNDIMNNSTVLNMVTAFPSLEGLVSRVSSCMA